MIKIRIKHFYSPEEKTQALKVLKEKELRRSDSLACQFGMIPEGEYELDTSFLFSNQYNTAETKEHKGYRIFEFCERLDSTHYGVKHSGIGYYIAEGIEQIRELQAHTFACGYCGKQYHGTSKGFCSACLDSEYLKESKLHLLRLLPVIEHNPTRAPLTDEEKAELMPLYIKHQTTGTTSRAVLARKKALKGIEEKHKKALHTAKAEYRGFLWLYEKGINLENFIYYAHTEKFSLGWRSPIEKALLKEWEKKLVGFPYPIEIKTA